MSDIIFILIVTCTIPYILSTQSMQLVNLYLPSLYFTFDPGLTVTVNFIFTLREPNVHKPHGFCLSFLAAIICFCVSVLFYRYLYFVVNQIKLQRTTGAWCPFLESPGNFSDPKSNIQIEIKRIRPRVLAKKLLHFVSLTDSFIMLDAKLLKPRSLM